MSKGVIVVLGVLLQVFYLAIYVTDSSAHFGYFDAPLWIKYVCLSTASFLLGSLTMWLFHRAAIEYMVDVHKTTDVESKTALSQEY